MGVSVFKSNIKDTDSGNTSGCLAVVLDNMPTKEEDIHSLSDDIRAAVQDWDKRHSDVKKEDE